jgi:hypothetical protein
MTDEYSTPKELADLIDNMVGEALRGGDREMAAILVTAREALRALGWNRYASRVNARSNTLALTRRIRNAKGWRMLHVMDS